MKIIKPDKVSNDPEIYALRLEMPKYLDKPRITYQPTAKGGDKWYADIFVEVTK
jgi:hypothetical protein